jgi:hypothetical protein
VGTVDDQLPPLDRVRLRRARDFLLHPPSIARRNVPSQQRN